MHFRSIVDLELLKLPNASQRVRDDIRAGEDVRVHLRLPIKLVLADHRVAVIPLNLASADSPSLLVRSSALLDALYELFETLWERSVPLAFSATGEPQIENLASRLSDESGELIQLMASGLNDKKIASELHISIRTLERRVAELMQELGTRTRFQTGWLAALRLSGSEVMSRDKRRGRR